jgi:TfoX/Sxy family transcriptional regulator of competence genes
MAYNQELAGRVRDVLIRMARAEEKNMFGGIGFMVKGNMAVGVYKEDLVVRLDPARQPAALKKMGVRPFDITGKPMKGWILVSQDACRTNAMLTDWIESALEFVNTLPKK